MVTEGQEAQVLDQTGEEDREDDVVGSGEFHKESEPLVDCDDVTQTVVDGQQHQSLHVQDLLDTHIGQVAQEVEGGGLDLLVLAHDVDGRDAQCLELFLGHCLYLEVLVDESDGQHFCLVTETQSAVEHVSQPVHQGVSQVSGH